MCVLILLVLLRFVIQLGPICCSFWYIIHWNSWCTWGNLGVV